MVKTSTIRLPQPLQYQKDILKWLEEDETMFVAFSKSRQSGGSFLNKMLVTKWGLESGGNKIGYVTPTTKLGKLFFRELNITLKDFISEKNATDLIITFKTGSVVQFMSSESGDALRGFQYTHCIIDEAAFINDDVYYYVINPSFMIKGKKMIMCSTPNSNQGFFYNNVNYGLELEKGYKTKLINIYDNPFVTLEQIDLIKKQIPDKVFRQEYLAEFLDGSGTVFNNFKNCVGDTLLNSPRHDRYYAAIDWGKTNDYTVLTIMNDRKEVVFLYRINLIEYTEQLKIIVNLLNKWKPVITISEQNNIGQVINELLKKEYKGNLRIINLDNKFKKEMIETLVVGFEQKDIVIPNDDTLLRELQSFTCKYNPSTQTIKYTAPQGLHDDMVISLAYCYHLVKNVFKKTTVLR